jgi:hypothetical protein
MSQPVRRFRTPTSLTRLILVLSVVVAMVAVTGAAVASYSVVRLAVQQHQINQILDQTARNRTANTRRICVAINRNAASSNAQAAVIQELIVAGARDSGAFEDLYRSHGFPNYNARVRAAERVAAKVKKRNLPIINCTTLIQSIMASSR